MTNQTQIEKFVSQLKTASTKRQYKAVILDFFAVTGKDCETFHKKDMSEIEKAVETFINYLIKKYEADKLSPKSVGVRWDGLRSYLLFCRKPLQKDFTKIINKRLPKRKSISKEKVTTMDELREIMSFADITSKSIILCLLSTGCRIDELLSIPLDDLYLDDKYPHIYMREKYMKNGETRYGLLTQEAVSVMKSWLKYRDKYIKNKKGVSETTKANDNRIFPMSYENFNHMWNNLLEKCGLNQKDNRTGISFRHIHTIKKRTRSELSSHPELNESWVHLFVGQSGYLTAEYRHKTLEELGEMFKKVEHLLTIGGTKNNKIQSEKIQTLESKVGDRLEDIQTLTGEIREIRKTNKLLIDSVELNKIKYEKLMEYTVRLRQIYSKMSGENPYKDENELDEFIKMEEALFEMEKNNGYVKALLEKRKKRKDDD